MSLRASIVVPTYRRPDLLNRCLAALVVQNLDPADYEVIVADNAADLETKQEVEKWSAGSGRRVRYLAAAHAPGPAAARNVGWQAAGGEIIAFTDDDCVPQPNWLEAGMATLHAHGAAAAGGKICVPLPSRPTDYEQNEAGLERAEFATANCFCRREVLAAVGGFDERFTTAWREDSDFQFKLLEAGQRVVAAPAAVVVHPVRPAHWAISLSQQRKSMFNALLYKNHPGLYRGKIEKKPPWHYYATCTAWLAALVSAALGQAAFAWAGVALGMVLSGRFCMRRLRRTSHAPYHIAEMLVTSVFIPPLSLFWRIWGAFKFRVLFW